MILLKDLQMISQQIDSTGQQGDLNISAPGIFIVKAKCGQVDVFTRCHRFTKVANIGQ
jgi:flagellar hook protein FlgE